MLQHFRTACHTLAVTEEKINTFHCRNIQLLHEIIIQATQKNNSHLQMEKMGLRFRSTTLEFKGQCKTLKNSEGVGSGASLAASTPVQTAASEYIHFHKAGQELHWVFFRNVLITVCQTETELASLLAMRRPISHQSLRETEHNLTKNRNVSHDKTQPELPKDGSKEELISGAQLSPYKVQLWAN